MNSPGNDRVDARFKDARKRILDAARSEMVAHGIAGARIDRIARLAGTSKERIYAYFKDKNQLMNAVARERMLMLQHAVRFDANDLPAYVASLFDFYSQHPDDVRLAHWLSLADGDDRLGEDDPRIVSLNERVAAIRQAQRDDVVDARWDPLILLNMLVSIGMGWATAPVFVRQIGPKPKIQTISGNAVNPRWKPRAGYFIPQAKTHCLGHVRRRSLLLCKQLLHDRKEPDHHAVHRQRHAFARWQRARIVICCWSMKRLSSNSAILATANCAGTCSANWEVCPC